MNVARIRRDFDIRHRRAVSASDYLDLVCALAFDWSPVDAAARMTNNQTTLPSVLAISQCDIGIADSMPAGVNDADYDGCSRFGRASDACRRARGER